MKLLMKLSITLISLVLIVGCSSAKEAQLGKNVNYEKVEKYPKWVIQPQYDGGIAGIGSAKISDLGFDFARKEAMSSARVDLGAQISVKVNNLFKSYAAHSGIGENSSVDKLAENVTKEIVNIDLHGASLQDTWISQENELYVLMVVKNEQLEKMMRKAIGNKRNSYNVDSKLTAQLKSKEGQAALDTAIKEVVTDEKGN